MRSRRVRSNKKRGRRYFPMAVWKVVPTDLHHDIAPITRLDIFLFSICCFSKTVAEMQMLLSTVRTY